MYDICTYVRPEACPEVSMFPIIIIARCNFNFNFSVCSKAIMSRVSYRVFGSCLCCPLQFVVTGGSAARMGKFAELIAKEINYPQVAKEELSIHKTDRFSFYKIGPVLSVSVSTVSCSWYCYNNPHLPFHPLPSPPSLLQHGMGVPSITILLHEILKLLYYAGADDPIIMRMGTSGGIGEP